MKESDTQKAILDYLAIKRIFHWRNNTGATKIGERFVRFGDKGSPDIFAVQIITFSGGITGGQVYGIEVKSDTNGKQSEEQHNWQEHFEEAGGVYILARSLDDVIAHL